MVKKDTIINNKIKEPVEDKIFNIVNVLLTLFGIVIFLYPLIFIVSASFSDPNEVNSGRMVLLPRKFTLEGYRLIFTNKDIWRGYANTIFYTVFGTLLNFLFTLPCAYSMSRDDFRVRGIVMRFFMVTMFFSGGMIPSYILMKNLHLLNTRLIMILPGAFSLGNMILCRTFFKTSIPKELLEAAKLDGCGDFKFFIKIVLPLSTALIAVMCLYFSVGHWNTYFNGLIYLTDRKKFSLQMILQEIIVQKDMSSVDKTLSALQQEYELERQRLSDSIKYGIIIVGSLPVLIAYPFVQKFFVKGVMLGSLKG